MRGDRWVHVELSRRPKSCDAAARSGSAEAGAVQVVDGFVKQRDSRGTAGGWSVMEHENGVLARVGLRRIGPAVVACRA